MSISRPQTFPRQRTHGAVACLILLAALLAPASVRAARPDAPGTVRGTVTDLAGEPLAEATVTLSVSGEVRAEAITDRKGAFSLKVTPGQYLLAFERSGYARFESPLSVAAGSRQVLSAELLDEAASRQSQAAKSFNSAAAAYEARDMAAAKRGFQAALEADPTLIEAHRVLAGIYLDEGAWTEAASSAEAFLETQPDDREVRLIAYEAYRKLDDRAKLTSARSRLGEVAELAPKLAMQAFNEGLAADQGGETGAAAARFEEALSLDPSLAVAHFALATIDYRAERYDECLARLEDGFELEPASVQGRRLAFLVRDAQGDADATIAALAAYAEVDAAGASDAAEILVERAEVDLRELRIVAARKAMDGLLRIDPDHAAAHHLLGLAYLSSDTARAKRHLSRFLEVAPQDPEAETVREILSKLE